MKAVQLARECAHLFRAAKTLLAIVVVRGPVEKQRVEADGGGVSLASRDAVAMPASLFLDVVSLLVAREHGQFKRTHMTGRVTLWISLGRLMLRLWSLWCSPTWRGGALLAKQCVTITGASCNAQRQLVF
jgi:hypothetical protein